jgi:hypothetical protein
MKRTTFLKSLGALFLTPSLLAKVDQEEVTNEPEYTFRANDNKRYISAISLLDERDLSDWKKLDSLECLDEKYKKWYSGDKLIQTT